MLAPEHDRRVLASGRMLAPDGRCKTFDAAADGYVRGEGCGDGRAQAAVGRAGGRRPHPRGHPRLGGEPGRPQQRAHGAQRARAGGGDSRRRSRAPASSRPTVDYVEAHGTGTSLGDPIEVEALDAVLGKAALRIARCSSVR